MGRNLGTFVEKYHRVGDQHLTIDSTAVENSAMQEQLLISIPGDALLDLEYLNKDGAPSVDLALKLDMLVVLAVFTFVGAILFGAF